MRNILEAYISLFSGRLIVLLASCFEELLYVLPELLTDELIELCRGLFAGGSTVRLGSGAANPSTPPVELEEECDADGKLDGWVSCVAGAFRIC